MYKKKKRQYPEKRYPGIEQVGEWKTSSDDGVPQSHQVALGADSHQGLDLLPLGENFSLQTPRQPHGLVPRTKLASQQYIHL